MQCPAAYKNFLTAVSKNYATCGFVQPQYAAVELLALVHEQQPFDLHAIEHMQQFLPLLHGLVQECRLQSIPTEWQEFAGRACSSCSQSHHSCRDQQHNSACCDSCCAWPLCLKVFDMQTPDHAVAAGHEDQHCFMPAYRVCRSLPPFAADKGRTRDEQQGCSKCSRKHARWTPGVLTLFCAHGKCLGCHLMTDQEGPRQVFDLIYTRFKIGEKELSSKH